ncbi:MAG TPA: TIGR03862 family flavoprotein [Chthoniobacterales bacterium]|nr:TIGR03862 family flavoprotein [Chthoniobacterales bacterium]
MNVAIVGGGPAGLRAAEVAAEAEASVTLYDAKPSVGRKFLVAGRGGLNLTNTEPFAAFRERYGTPRELWRSLLTSFDADALREWANSLGIETFCATTGRVYPREMKAAPLLRRWLQRLRRRGVTFAAKHRLIGIHSDKQVIVQFDGPEGSVTKHVDAAVLALGGGSWPQTGSDGTWVETLSNVGIAVMKLEPANCGWECDWSPEVLQIAEGKPLKNIVARALTCEVGGELLVTRYGLEGGAIYQLGPALRAMPEPVITIDFKPSFTVAQLVDKLGPARRNLLGEARTRWRLSDAAFAVVKASATSRKLDSGTSVAELVKHCDIRLSRPRPLAEAISSAGGISWSELDDSLMLRRLPGVFAAGEMIDWEAPTGGYLIQGAFATGTRAGDAAVEWARSNS